MTRLRSMLLAAALATGTADIAAAQCAGDCDGDGQVAINELIIGVTIALGSAPVSACATVDADGDGQVAINELIGAVNNALAGCPATPTATATAAPPTETATAEPSATVPPTATAPATATDTAPATATPVASDTATPPAVTDTPAPTATITATPTASRTATPTQQPPVCGNGNVENLGGETCDDGNTIDNDGCPSTCRVELCAPSGQRFRVDVAFATAGPEQLAQALVLFLRYPDGVIDVPGKSVDPPVLASVTSELFSVSPRDFDYAIRLLLEDPTLAGLAGGVAASVEFELCQGASLPSLDTLTCTVESASDPNFVELPLDQVSCSLSAGDAPTPTATVDAEATPTPTVGAPATATATAPPAAATATFTPTATPTAGSSAVCGNGLLEPGETCGACATDCAVGACANPGAPTQAYVVSLDPPVGFQPTTATVLLAYDSTALSLPGSGTATSVRQRVVAPAPVPQAFTPNDLEYGVRVLVSRNVPLGTLFTATFDTCAGAPAPTLADVACSIEGCAAGGSPIPGCGCTIALP